MTYYDRLKEFYSASERLNLKASEQLIMLHLLHINNCVGNPDSFYCTNERLATLSHLTVKAVKEAKCTLKNHGLIDFESDPKKPRKPTRYILPTTLNSTLNGTPNSTPNSTPNGTPNGTLNNVVVFNAREDKTKTRPDKTTTPTTTATRGHELYDVPSAEVQETWLKCEGELFKGSIAFGLFDLEKMYGTQALCGAILTASQGNKAEKLTYPFVKKVLENQTKGGKVNVRNNGVTGSAEEWEHNANWFDD